MPESPPIWLAFQAADCATIYAQGEIDIVTAPTLEAAMVEALSGNRDLVVDLSRVSFFGVAGRLDNPVIRSSTRLRNGAKLKWRATKSSIS